jgi:drug/metabolite transporter (DMT)-like permease
LRASSDAGGPLLAPPAPAPHPAVRPWGAYAILVLCFLIWSNSFAAVRALVSELVPANERLGPYELVVVRFAPVALFCLAWFALLPGARRAAREVLGWRPGLVVALGLLAVWVYNLAFAAGMGRVSAGAGAVVTAINPVLTFLLAWRLGQERATAAKFAGLALATAGVYVVVVHGAGRAVEVADLRAGALLLLAPASWAVFTVLSKPLLGGRSPLHLTFLVLGLASLPTLPLAAFDPALAAKLALWGVGRWGAALFLSLACTVLGFWLWYEALRHLTASRTAAFVFLNPPLALFFEWLWFGRAPASGLLAGGAVVLVGVYLCLRPSRRPTLGAGESAPPGA